MAGPRKALKELGARVRRRRNDLRMTQEDLADAAGLTAPYVSQIERGERDFGVTILLRLLPALRLTPAELLAAESARPIDPLTAALYDANGWPETKRDAALAILRALRPLGP